MKQMKNIICTILISILLSACTQDNAVPKFELQGASVKPTTEDVKLSLRYQNFGQFQSLELYFADNEQMANAHRYDLTNVSHHTDEVHTTIDNLFPGHTYYYYFRIISAYDVQETKVAQFSTNKGALPEVVTLTPSGISDNAYECSGAISSTGDCIIRECGVCWGPTSNIDLHNNAGVKTSEIGTTFAVQLTNLEYNTEYYVRAYAKNILGLTYGDVQSFRTSVGVKITTTMVSTESTVAYSGGNITRDGDSPITQRGVCWSTHPNPTTSDNMTKDGSGSGVYKSTLVNLTPSTTYYVRAYAKNAKGTFYGDEQQFTTTDK